jgi:hypothetical protein
MLLVTALHCSDAPDDADAGNSSARPKNTSSSASRRARRVDDSGALGDAGNRISVANPAQLLVRWSLGFASCEAIGVETFVIELYGDTKADPLLQAAIPCTQAGDDAEQYREVPDPDSYFDGTRPGTVKVQAHAASQGDVGRAAVFKFAAPGAGQTVRLTVDCGTSVCTGSGKPDA